MATAVYGIVNNLFNTRPSFAGKTVLFRHYDIFFISERKNEPVRECCAPVGNTIGGQATGCGKCPGLPNPKPCSDEPVPCFGIPTAEEAQSFLQNCGNETEAFIEEHCTVEKTFYDYMMAEGTVEFIFFSVFH